MKELIENENGITLMALVVTIIILLILAGISIGMLSWDNSIIKQAGNAKTQTEIAEEKEILEQATVVVMGKSKYGNVEKDKLEDYLTNDVDREIQTTSRGKKIYAEFIDSHRFYSIDTDGNVEELGENYEIPMIITASDIVENPELYDGKYVTNYDSPNDNKIIDKNGQLGKWQIFLAHDNNIYLIASNCISTSPSRIIGEDTLEYSVGLTTSTMYFYSLYSKYTDSIISNVLQDLSNKNGLLSNYHKWMNVNGTNSSKNYENKKSIASMLDTELWNDYCNTTYAHYTIGGPTIEMFRESYNQTHTEETQIIENEEYDYGYKIKKENAEDSNSINGLYTNSILDSMYFKTTYWLSSPSAYAKTTLLSINGGGAIQSSGFGSNNIGFRPITCLKSEFHLEAHVQDGNTTYTIEAD